MRPESLVEYEYPDGPVWTARRKSAMINA
jgi:hypothetical protein